MSYYTPYNFTPKTLYAVIVYESTSNKSSLYWYHVQDILT